MGKFTKGHKLAKAARSRTPPFSPSSARQEAGLVTGKMYECTATRCKGGYKVMEIGAIIPNKH